MSFQDKDQPQKRVCLGRIAAPHGVKGLVKLLPYGEDSSLLSGELYTSEDGAETLHITLKNPLGKYILADIKGCDDRNRSEELKGTELYLDRAALPDLEGDDGFYYDDLIDLKVLNKDDDHIGKVIGVDNFGAGDLIEIQPTSGQSFYVPFIDDYILEIDLEQKIIRLQDIAKFQDQTV